MSDFQTRMAEAKAARARSRARGGGSGGKLRTAAELCRGRTEAEWIAENLEALKGTRAATRRWLAFKCRTLVRTTPGTVTTEPEADAPPSIGYLAPKRGRKQPMRHRIMTGEEYEELLAELGETSYSAAPKLGITYRTSRRYALGQWEIPLAIQKLIRLSVEINCPLD